jgi:hypothetical protein
VSAFAAVAFESAAFEAAEKKSAACMQFALPSTPLHVAQPPYTRMPRLFEAASVRLVSRWFRRSCCLAGAGGEKRSLRRSTHTSSLTGFARGEKRGSERGARALQMAGAQRVGVCGLKAALSSPYRHLATRKRVSGLASSVVSAI